MLAATGVTLLVLWLILWAIYHVPSAALNAPLLVGGLAFLLLSVVLSREDGEEPPQPHQRELAEWHDEAEPARKSKLIHQR